MKTDYLERQSYPTDLTDTQWATIAPLFIGMREYKHSKREIRGVNGVNCPTTSRRISQSTVYSNTWLYYRVKKQI